jgi:DNA-binding NarL/FixJ family response regulator
VRSDHNDVVKQAIAVLGDLAGDPVPALRQIANTSSIDDAICLIDGLLELSSASASSPWLRCLAVEFLFVSGRTRDSIEMAGPLRHCPIGTVAGTATLTELIATFRLDRATAVATARRLLKDPSDGIEVIAASAVIAEAAWEDGRLEEGVRFARLAADRAAQVPSPFWRSYLKLQLAAKLVDIGQPTEAGVIADEVATSGDRDGHPGNEAAFDLISAKTLIQLGNPWAVQDVAYGQTLRSARRMGERLFTPVLLAHLGIASAYAEDFDSAREYLTECTALQQRCDAAAQQVPISWLRLLITAAESGPGAAVATVRELESANRLLPMFAQLPGSAAWCARQARLTGATELLDQVISACAEVQQVNPGLPQLQLAEQHASSLRSDDVAGLAAAATGQEHGWAKACAAADLAAIVQHAGPPLRTDTEGALPVNEPGHPGASDRLGQQLSAREQQVAQLVVQGLTNRQIASRTQCSPHTVNFHIRNIFRKLGIHSRIEIAHYFTQQGPVTATDHRSAHAASSRS